MKIAIVGAGIAGLSCADVLADRGHSVVLFDKGRGPGGRMSTRRLKTSLGEVSVDHGAQYFTVRDDAFTKLVKGWASCGLAAPWPLAGKDAWVGVPTMNAVINDMCNRHDVSFGQLVRGLYRESAGWYIATDEQRFGPFDAVMLAIPAEQASPILALHDFSFAKTALNARSQPCWTGMFVFDERLPVDEDAMRDMGDIAWAARNNAKPGRSGPEAWVVQATSRWSLQNLEDMAEAVLPKLTRAFAMAINSELPDPVSAVAHRWRFALSAGNGVGSLWNSEIGLGVCGDWLLGPRVECAWLSGRHLAQSVANEEELLVQGA